MTDRKHTEETISKALAMLQDLSKGHQSRGTASTAVESMSGQGGSTQIFHTSSNSDPGGWAGSTGRDVPENGATDSIEADGTDLKGVSGGLMKSIMEKVEKGLALTAAEAYVLKSVISKAGKPFGEDDEDEDDEDDDKKGKKKKPPFMKKAQDEDDEEADKKVSKGLADHASSNDQVQKGLEMSPFLAGWAQVQADAASSSEARIVSRLSKSLMEIDSGNAMFQAELAKSVAALAEVLVAQAQRVESLETSPARGPRSTQVQPIEKSFGAGGPPQTNNEEMSKALVLDTMIDMVQKGKLHSQEVVKFESTNELRPDLQHAILAHRSGR